MTMTAPRRHIAACSFCFKSNTVVEALIAGPGVFICDGCVGLCQQILGDTPGRDPVSLSPFEKMEDPEQLLANLPQIAAAGAQVEQYLASGVRRARQLGTTWARIGVTLGMTRQSAWERFSGED